MTPDEIQALREKHTFYDEFGLCDFCYQEYEADDYVYPYVSVAYPCDVIKVLDAWDAERKEIVTALSRGHHEMYEIVNEIAKVLYGQQ